MSRYIDADAAYEAACEGADNWDGGCSPYRDDCIREELDKVPTVDAVQVVRCKECKHNMDDFAWNGEPYKWCELQHQHMADDFFCADGERRTDDETKENNESI